MSSTIARKVAEATSKAVNTIVTDTIIDSVFNALESAGVSMTSEQTDRFKSALIDNLGDNTKASRAAKASDGLAICNAWKAKHCKGLSKTDANSAWKKAKPDLTVEEKAELLQSWCARNKTVKSGKAFEEYYFQFRKEHKDEYDSLAECRKAACSKWDHGNNHTETEKIALHEAYLARKASSESE